MKKSGFTFIELLAVITIIGVLSLISIPTIEKLLKDNKQKIYETQLSNIVLSLKNWATDNKEILPSSDKDYLSLTLGQLKSEGYIDFDIKNPNTNKCFDNSMILKIVKNVKNYNYSIDEDTIAETDTCEIDKNAPIIMLLGNVSEDVEVNSTYLDQGVIAKDKDGNDITNRVSKKITGSGNAIDTSVLNNQYTITYTVSDNGKLVSIVRTVKIVDTLAPNLVIPGNTQISLNTTSFDVMNGVRATDNSKETINITVKSNLVLGLLGKYTITYTAIDSSGNKIVKNRIITVSESVVEKEKTLSDLATTDTTLGVNTINSCATSGTCANGTEFVIKVNDSEQYKFYSIKDENNKITLIMDRNIGTKVAWIKKADYIAAGGADWGLFTGNNNKGPLTVLNALEERTSNWTNIPSMTYILSDDKSEYQPITRSNVKSRMLTYKEATSLGCSNSCPSYLSTNLSLSNTDAKPKGYWLSSTYSFATDGARYVDSYGQPSFTAVDTDDESGFRPVITLSKTL